MLGDAYAVQGVLVGTEQPAAVSRRAQQVGALAQGGVVLGGHEEGVAVPGDDLDRVVVLVAALTVCMVLVPYPRAQFRQRAAN
jgi:hypothetical protein